MVAFFVILTIVAFVAVDSVVQWREARKAQPARRPVAQPPGVFSPALAFHGLSAPGGVFLDSGHTWVGLDASGRAHVGMDDFIQRVIGRIDGVELPEVGRQVRRGEKLFAIRQGERTAEFAAPMDGVVRSVNESLARHPEAIKADPYAQGWICALSPKNLASNLKQLSIAEEGRAWLDKEVERFQSFFAGRPVQVMALGHVLQDGGQLTDGVLEFMDDESWSIFTSEFLRGPAVAKH
jgi:glycine cleavage system H lipoate-binding protein